MIRGRAPPTVDSNLRVASRLERGDHVRALGAAHSNGQNKDKSGDGQAEGAPTTARRGSVGEAPHSLGKATLGGRTRIHQ